MSPRHGALSSSPCPTAQGHSGWSRGVTCHDLEGPRLSSAALQTPSRCRACGATCTRGPPSPSPAGPQRVRPGVGPGGDPARLPAHLVALGAGAQQRQGGVGRGLPGSATGPRPGGHQGEGPPDTPWVGAWDAGPRERGPALAPAVPGEEEGPPAQRKSPLTLVFSSWFRLFGSRKFAQQTLPSPGLPGPGAQGGFPGGGGRGREGMLCGGRVTGPASLLPEPLEPLGEPGQTRGGVCRRVPG